jgi:hypothetical protein
VYRGYHKLLHKDIGSFLPPNLESFEIEFMREPDLEAEISRWEKSLKTSEEVIKTDPKLEPTVAVSSVISAVIIKDENPESKDFAKMTNFMLVNVFKKPKITAKSVNFQQISDIIDKNY